MDLVQRGVIAQFSIESCFPKASTVILQVKDNFGFFLSIDKKQKMFTDRPTGLLILTAAVSNTDGDSLFIGLVSPDSKTCSPFAIPGANVCGFDGHHSIVYCISSGTMATVSSFDIRSKNITTVGTFQNDATHQAFVDGIFVHDEDE